MKCANCGNDNPKTLHNEGDTFYCSLCCHRTQTATGQDDLITCPYCGRLRDRKAFQCMWCGNSIGQNVPPAKEDYEEVDKILTEFEEDMASSNIRFWKLRDKKRQ
jgi:DNA-directed RNA polymerase subunit RPC12/RpoP